MATDAPAVVETIFEPPPSRQQAPFAPGYPWQFTFTGEDVLEISSWNSAASVKVTVQGRVHQANGEVKPFQHTHTANTDRTIATSVATVPAGDLLNVIAYCESGAPLMGQTFVRVAVRRGAGAAFTRLGALIQGPITATIARAFPGSPLIATVEAEPVWRTIVGTTPSVGGTITETVPTAARWELLSFNAVASAIAGTHVGTVPILILNSPAASIIARMPTSRGFPTDNLTTAQWLPVGIDSIASDFTLFGPLPIGIRLLAGSTIQLSGVPGNYTWGAPVYSVREWLDP